MAVWLLTALSVIMPTINKCPKNVRWMDEWTSLPFLMLFYSPLGANGVSDVGEATRREYEDILRWQGTIN